MARALLDRNRAREARRQAILLDRLAAQFRGRVKAELAAAMRDMVGTWEHTLTVILPPGFRARLEVIYAQMAIAAVQAFGGRILDQGKSAGLVLERKRDFATTMTETALGYVQQEAIRRRITDVAETTRRQIINQVDQGYREGLGTAEIGRNIRDNVDGIAGLRANVIARTETHGAANFGSNEAAALTGLPLKREWLAAHDLRTRTVNPLIGDPDEYGHLQANGQIVGMEQPFLIPMRGGGTEALMYPGDPKGSPGNTVNCRCSIGFIVDDGLDDEEQAPETPAPAPAFAYEVFTPAATIAEAVMAMEASIVRTVDLSRGASLQGLNATHAAALEAIERFGLKPMNFLGDPTKSSYNYKWNPKYTAAFGMKTNEYLVKVAGLDEAGVAAKYVKSEAYKVAAYNQVKAVLAQSTFIDPEVRLRFNRMNSTDFSWSPISDVRGVTLHEMGHKLHSEYFQQINAPLPPISKGWSYLISQYARTDGEELFAESFALYMLGDTSQYYRIYPPILQFIKSLDKKGKIP